MLCIDNEKYSRMEYCKSLPLVLLQAAAAGPQTDTAHFACWEAHTRGLGSKLMAAMGFRQGQGLGPRNAGTAAPIEVIQLPMHLLSRIMAMERNESRAVCGYWQHQELGAKCAAASPEERIPDLAFVCTSLKLAM